MKAVVLPRARQNNEQRGNDVKKIMIAFLILILLGVCGYFLFQHFVTNQIMDRGGMENPYTMPEDEGIADGNYTYVANEVLLQKIAGTWESTDGRWKMTLDENYGITISLDGETVLEDTLAFSYLQPGEVLSTEFSLASGDYTLNRADDSRMQEIMWLCHETVKDDEHGKIDMVLSDEEADEEVIEFKQCRFR